MVNEHHWKNMLPVDRYIVRMIGSLHDMDRTVLTRLYLPLMGADAYSLYMTLWAEADSYRYWSDEAAHVTLMSLTQMDLKAVYEARKVLEGIGLLKTFLKKNDDERMYLYELQAPLTPKQFFNDGLLNVYLYNRLGKTTFHKVKKDFLIETVDETDFESVTHTFNEVFTSLSPSEMMTLKGSESNEAQELEEGFAYKDRSEGEPAVVAGDFDIEWLISGISGNFMSTKAFTPAVKEAIRKLAYLYNISELDMQRVVLNAVDLSSDAIDIAQLRKEASVWYQTRNGGQLPSLAKRTHPAVKRTAKDTPATDEEKKIQYWETVSPYQVIKDISGGEPSAADLKIIEDIMFNQKLLPGIVNVLLEFVMLKQDMKLSKNYIEKIAAHWARKDLQTVQEAMEFAKAEHQKAGAIDKGKKQRSYRKKAIRTEMVPDWLENDDQGNKEHPSAQEASINIDEERKKLEESLKEFKRKS